MSPLQARGLALDGSSGDHWAETSSGLVVPSYATPPALPVGVDLFAGAGGFSLGFHQAGFHVAGASEWEPTAAATYLCNLGGPDTVIHVGLTPPPKANKRDRTIFERYGGQTEFARDVFEAAGTGWIAAERNHEPGSCADHIDDLDERVAFCDTYHASPEHRLACEHFWMCDVHELTGDEIVEAVGDVACLFGGPPCQGFSTSGKRNVEDPRNSLVFEFARLVLEVNPATMVMENVPGLASMTTPEGVNVVDALTKILADGGYGEYDALRRSLLATAGVKPGAAVRGSARPKRTGSLAVDDDVEVDDAQASLFEEVPVG